MLPPPQPSPNHYEMGIYVPTQVKLNLPTHVKHYLHYIIILHHMYRNRDIMQRPVIKDQVIMFMQLWRRYGKTYIHTVHVWYNTWKHIMRSVLLSSIDLLWCVTSQTQAGSEGRTLSFFEECDLYWRPASTREEIYQQLAQKKYREIPRHQIQ